MKKSLILILVMGIAISFAGVVAIAKCGKGVTIRNDNASDITITQISYSLAGAGVYTVWPNKQGAPGVPHVLAAGASWVPNLSNRATNCNKAIDVKIDYTIGGVATYEVDEITKTQRLVTVQKN